MWLFLPASFLSVVAARHLKISGQPVDPDRLVVRARMRVHLDALQERHLDLLAGCAITEDRARDYRFRLLVGKPAFAEVMKREVLALVHTNFKSEVERVNGFDAEYARACHRVWGEMLPLQEPRRDRGQRDRMWREHKDDDRGGDGLDHL